MASETAAAWHLVGVTGSAEGAGHVTGRGDDHRRGGLVVSTGVSGMVLPLSTAVVSLDEGGTLELSTQRRRGVDKSVSCCSVNDRRLAAARGHRFSAARATRADARIATAPSTTNNSSCRTRTSRPRPSVYATRTERAPRRTRLQHACTDCATARTREHMGRTFRERRDILRIRLATAIVSGRIRPP